MVDQIEAYVRVDDDVWKTVAWCKNHFGYLPMIRKNSEWGENWYVKLRSEADAMAFKLTFHE